MIKRGFLKLSMLVAVALFACVSLVLAAEWPGYAGVGIVSPIGGQQPIVQLGQGSIGSACTSAAGCTSGFCKCACKACTATADCPTGKTCSSGKCVSGIPSVTGQLTLTLPPGYVPPSIITPPIVVGNLNVSQACTTNASCKSGLCKNSKCWCKVNADCETGKTCSAASGECTAPGLPVGVGIVSPIGGQQPIVQLGQGSIGSVCTSNDACDSGLCSCSCASCTADADCGAGKTCQNGACTTSPGEAPATYAQRITSLNNLIDKLKYYVKALGGQLASGDSCTASEQCKPCPVATYSPEKAVCKGTEGAKKCECTVTSPVSVEGF